MYDRRYAEQVLAFEASGGLLNASLVMRDRETDSWWSIMTADAIGGPLTGTTLKELPVYQKVQWSEWRERHPDTKVLSVGGHEHVNRDPYADYFTSDGGFRGLSSDDQRLGDKASIYAFLLDGQAYAVTHERIAGGAAFELDDGRQLFFYREPGESMFASTLAYVSDKQMKNDRFEVRDGVWIDIISGAEFDAASGFPIDIDVDGVKADGEATQLAGLGGFDTFWYIWATTHHMPVLLD